MMACFRRNASDDLRSYLTYRFFKTTPVVKNLVHQWRMLKPTGTPPAKGGWGGDMQLIKKVFYFVTNRLRPNTASTRDALPLLSLAISVGE